MLVVRHCLREPGWTVVIALFRPTGHKPAVPSAEVEWHAGSRGAIDARSRALDDPWSRDVLQVHRAKLLVLCTVTAYGQACNQIEARAQRQASLWDSG